MASTMGWGTCWGEPEEPKALSLTEISRSTAGGTVTSTGWYLVGGLVGWNNGPISSSHATGDVRGVQWVGGLVGVELWSRGR